MEHVLAPHNLVFYLPLLIGALLALTAVLGGGDHGHHDHGVDLDADPDLDADIDGTDHGHDHGHGHGQGILNGLYAFFGFGRVSLFQLISILMMLFGGAGVVSNAFLKDWFGDPSGYGWISFAIAAAFSLRFSGSVARLVGLLLPSTETYVVRANELVGSSAKLISAASPKYGTALLTDKYGKLHQVSCRTGRDIEIANGSEVLLVDYDDEQQTYLIESIHHGDGR